MNEKVYSQVYFEYPMEKSGTSMLQCSCYLLVFLYMDKLLVYTRIVALFGVHYNAAIPF